MKWENLREEEFGPALETSKGVCVMAIGCLEKHGQHLPVGTDSLKGDKIVELASEKAGVMMFPTTMWLGDVTPLHPYEHPDKSRLRGYICMSHNTMLTVLEELCDEIARNGFKKIVICNSHGGNSAMLSLFVKSQCYKKKDYVTMWTKAYNFAELKAEDILEAYEGDKERFSMLTEEDIKTLRRFAETGSGGGHGDFKETMLVYGTHPDLVNPDRFDAENGLSIKRIKHPKEFGIVDGITFEANFPNAFSGFAPIGCTETIGKAAVDMSVERLSKIFEYIKNDDSMIDYNNERADY